MNATQTVINVIEWAFNGSGPPIYTYDAPALVEPSQSSPQCHIVSGCSKGRPLQNPAYLGVWGANLCYREGEGAMPPSLRAYTQVCPYKPQRYNRASGAALACSPLTKVIGFIHFVNHPLRHRN